MMIKIAICDDNREFCIYLQNIIEMKFGQSVQVAVYNDSAELKDNYEQGCYTADILLMDIELEGNNGIEVAAMIQKQFPEVKVIFVTGYIEYSTQIFNANPSNFLVKPITPEQFLKAIEKVMNQIEEEKRDCFTLTLKNSVIKVKLRDILYFESEKRKVILHGKENDWTIYSKLAQIQEELPDCFLRCHQSYLVNMNEIRSMKPLVLELYSGKTIPVSRPKYKEAKERFMNFLGHNPSDI